MLADEEQQARYSDRNGGKRGDCVGAAIGGIRFAMFLLAEYAGIVVLSALTAVLFLGGWHGPATDDLGWLWTLLKTGAVAFVVIWVRVAFPRLREDQLNALAWKVLVPVVLLQLALTTVVAVKIA